MRYDLELIASWIEPGSKVLDLGCGTGELLYYLRREKQVAGTGIERDEAKVTQCIQKGVSVLQGDINEEVLDYPDNTFDYVILSQTLQQVYEPDTLIQAILRVGKMGIVSFPNFGHWKSRSQLFLTGFAPITRQLPYEWYDTPNIRVISLNDFRKFIHQVDLVIIHEVAINTNSKDRHGSRVKRFPNLFGTYGLYLIGKGVV
jgi:methionine biosynthesis protein MetW